MLGRAAVLGDRCPPRSAAAELLGQRAGALGGDAARPGMAPAREDNAERSARLVAPAERRERLGEDELDLGVLERRLERHAGTRSALQVGQRLGGSTGALVDG